MTVQGAIWSDGTTTAIFIGMLRMQRSSYGNARVSITMEGNSGLCSATSAVIVGNKEADLPGATPSDFPTSPTVATADGIQVGGSFGALDATKSIVDFGVKVKNVSGTKREMAFITMTVDFTE